MFGQNTINLFSSCYSHCLQSWKSEIIRHQLTISDRKRFKVLFGRFSTVILHGTVKSICCLGKMNSITLDLNCFVELRVPLVHCMQNI